jgi:hypothetical protein
MICRLKYFVPEETYTVGVVVVGRGEMAVCTKHE